MLRWPKPSHQCETSKLYPSSPYRHLPTALILMSRVPSFVPPLPREGEGGCRFSRTLTRTEQVARPRRQRARPDQFK